MTENTKEPVLELKDITKIFDDNHVMKGFNLQIFEGENLTIMEKSGAGKSVMVKCLVGLMKTEGSSITIRGEDIIKMAKKNWIFFELKLVLYFKVVLCTIR